MKCPSCDVDLNREPMSHVEVDKCLTCEGIWLEHGELNSLIDQENQMAEFTTIDHDPGIHADSHPPRPCPACGRTMQKVNFLDESSDIIFDYCKECRGFWLDSGEIEKARKFIASQQEKNLPVLSPFPTEFFMLG